MEGWQTPRNCYLCCEKYSRENWLGHLRVIAAVMRNLKTWKTPCQWCIENIFGQEEVNTGQESIICQAPNINTSFYYTQINLARWRCSNSYSDFEIHIVHNLSDFILCWEADNFSLGKYIVIAFLWAGVLCAKQKIKRKLLNYTVIFLSNWCVAGRTHPSFNILIILCKLSFSIVLIFFVFLGGGGGGISEARSCYKKISSSLFTIFHNVGCIFCNCRLVATPQVAPTLIYW